MIDIPDSVFPQDEAGNLLCPRCKKPVKACACPSYEAPAVKIPRINPHIRIEKSGRQGKIVTLIEHLPANEAFLKEMSKVLKIKTGSGGTFYVAEGFGTIELQGNHKALVLKHFQRK